jgi:hypothetical protein
MTVALGGHKASLENLSASEVVARHAAVLVDFQKGFPIGGVASTDTDKTEAAATTPAPRHLAGPRCGPFQKQQQEIREN